MMETEIIYDPAYGQYRVTNRIGEYTSSGLFKYYPSPDDLSQFEFISRKIIDKSQREAEPPQRTIKDILFSFLRKAINERDNE